MKRWKVQLILTGMLFVLVVVFAFFKHRHIVAITPNTETIGTRDNMLGVAPVTDTESIDARDNRLYSFCSGTVGFGLVLIWLLPSSLQKVRRP